MIYVTIYSHREEVQARSWAFSDSGEASAFARSWKPYARSVTIGASVPDGVELVTGPTPISPIEAARQAEIPHSIPPADSSLEEQIERANLEVEVLKRRLDQVEERLERDLGGLEEHVNTIEGRIPSGLEGTVQDLERRVGNVEDDVSRMGR